MWVHSHQGRVFSDQLGIFHCLPSFVHGARLLYCFHFKLLKLSPSNKIWLRQYLCLERLGRKVRCLHIIPDQRTANIHLDIYQAAKFVVSSAFGIIRSLGINAEVDICHQAANLNNHNSTSILNFKILIHDKPFLALVQVCQQFRIDLALLDSAQLQSFGPSEPFSQSQVDFPHCWKVVEHSRVWA